ncbi:MAG: hypothetical protein H6622_14210 [Halobacteriovoraceae bacterium]|nr:hypothetical protein [Halobacteriovoraceae bacterium]
MSTQITLIHLLLLWVLALTNSCTESDRTNITPDNGEYFETTHLNNTNNQFYLELVETEKNLEQNPLLLKIVDVHPDDHTKLVSYYQIDESSITLDENDLKYYISAAIDLARYNQLLGQFLSLGYSTTEGDFLYCEYGHKINLKSEKAAKSMASTSIRDLLSSYLEEYSHGEDFEEMLEDSHLSEQLIVQYYSRKKYVGQPLPWLPHKHELIQNFEDKLVTFNSNIESIDKLTLYLSEISKILTDQVKENETKILELTNLRDQLQKFSLELEKALSLLNGEDLRSEQK